MGTLWKASLPGIWGRTPGQSLVTRGQSLATRRAFTLIEIAICLAVIGFALVAIIGILPFGMQVQKDNRQETIVAQDAEVLLNAIRNGNRALDDLTNYVVRIVNTYTDGSTNNTASVATYTYTNSTGTPIPFPINSGSRIIGLLSTPKICPSPIGGLRSNNFVAYVRSMSGAAVEKFPQSSADVDTFSYRMNVDVVPYGDYPPDWPQPVVSVVQTNLYDLRLTFRYPVDQNFVWKQGGTRQFVRTFAGGTMISTNDNGTVTPKGPIGITNYFLLPGVYYGTNAL
jgi:prepilin-type N-terminal cleavage/methylation domain-containing protein